MPRTDAGPRPDGSEPIDASEPTDARAGQDASGPPCAADGTCPGDARCVAGRCLDYGPGEYDDTCRRVRSPGPVLPQIQCAFEVAPDGDPRPEAVRALHTPLVADLGVRASPGRPRARASSTWRTTATARASRASATRSASFASSTARPAARRRCSPTCR
ncbi:MAG: hypothetical protein M5U28_27520 [Sandaracinaceae bacterium]|nr:hypothetical protein [Sandaracinaceae bacterium]